MPYYRCEACGEKYYTAATTADGDQYCEACGAKLKEAKEDG